MFSNDNIIIKNEPIETEDIEFVTEDIFLQKVDLKCDETKYRNKLQNSSYFVVSEDVHFPRTKAICTEIQYLADDNNAFESIIVKEEQKLNIYDEIVNANPLFSLNSNDSEDIRKETGSKKVKCEQDEKVFECFACKYIAKSVDDLCTHVKMHAYNQLPAVKQDQHGTKIEKLFACSQCDRTFTRSSSLTNHNLIHKSKKSFARDEFGGKREKLFACDQCDRKFLRNSYLNQHKQIHSGTKPYACNECERKFSDSSTLRKHKQTHSGERPFSCDRCDRKFSRNSTLVRHKLIHTGEKPFVCDQCNKKFTRKSSLNQHKPVHTGENPFPCNECDEQCLDSSTRCEEKQIHTIEKVLRLQSM